MNTALVHDLAAVDHAVLTAAARMIAYLRIVPDLREVELDPAAFGIDASSPQWDLFMQVTGRHDLRDVEPSHEALAALVAEFDSAIRVVLRGGGQ